MDIFIKIYIKNEMVRNSFECLDFLTSLSGLCGFISSTGWPLFTIMTCESPSQATYSVRPFRKVTTPVEPQRIFCSRDTDAYIVNTKRADMSILMSEYDCGVGTHFTWCLLYEALICQSVGETQSRFRVLTEHFLFDQVDVQVIGGVDSSIQSAVTIKHSKKSLLFLILNTHTFLLALHHKMTDNKNNNSSLIFISLIIS